MLPQAPHDESPLPLHTMTAAKILTRPELPTTLAAWRAAGERIVFTNGCFDLLHLGHVDYLEKARLR